MHAKVRIFSHFRHMFSTKNPKISYFNYYLPLPFKIFCCPLKNSCLSLTTQIEKSSSYFKEILYLCTQITINKPNGLAPKTI